jgi:hypothetical protein
MKSIFFIIFKEKIGIDGKTYHVMLSRANLQKKYKGILKGVEGLRREEKCFYFEVEADDPRPIINALIGKCGKELTLVEFDPNESWK